MNLKNLIWVYAKIEVDLLANFDIDYVIIVNLICEKYCSNISILILNINVNFTNEEWIILGYNSNWIWSDK